MRQLLFVISEIRYFKYKVKKMKRNKELLNKFFKMFLSEADNKSQA